MPVYCYDKDMFRGDTSKPEIAAVHRLFAEALEAANQGNRYRGATETIVVELVYEDGEPFYVRVGTKVRIEELTPELEARLQKMRLGAGDEIEVIVWSATQVLITETITAKQAA